MAYRPSTPISPFRSPVARFELAVCLAIGVAICVVGIREVALFSAQLPGTRTIENLKALQQVSAEQMDSAISAEKNAVAISGTASDWSNLSIALSAKATIVDEPDRTNLLEQADQAATNGLARGPANPYA